jgi:hypothetical protein
MDQSNDRHHRRQRLYDMAELTDREETPDDAFRRTVGPYVLGTLAGSASRFSPATARATASCRRS